jgi:hypothetical protein
MGLFAFQALSRGLWDGRIARLFDLRDIDELEEGYSE